MEANNFSAAKKFRVLCSACKVMTNAFCDDDGIVLIDYLEHGSTTTRAYYAELIRKVHSVLRDTRRGQLRRGVLFYQSNSPSLISSQAVAAIRNAVYEPTPSPTIDR